MKHEHREIANIRSVVFQSGETRIYIRSSAECEWATWLIIRVSKLSLDSDQVTAGHDTVPSPHLPAGHILHPALTLV